MDLKHLNRVIEQSAEEKGIDKRKILEVVESSISTAYKKENAKRGEIIKAKLDSKTGEVKFWKIKNVVDENTVLFDEEKRKEKKEEGEEVLPLYNPERHILIKEAKDIKSDVQVGEDLEFPLEEREDFGRIAAQAAKQVILQKIREA